MPDTWHDYILYLIISKRILVEMFDRTKCTKVLIDISVRECSLNRDGFPVSHVEFVEAFKCADDMKSTNSTEIDSLITRTPSCSCVSKSIMSDIRACASPKIVSDL